MSPREGWNVRTLLCFTAAAAATTLAGCGPSGPVVVPVTGKVTFEDGSLLKGEILTITFTPAGIGHVEGMASASGDISREDGTFKLMTGAKEGATTGDYRVTITGMSSYAAQRRDVVAPEYGDFDDTPLKETVEKKGDNFFEFKVKPFK